VTYISSRAGIGTVKSQVTGHSILKQAYITLLLTSADRTVVSSEEKKQAVITQMHSKIPCDSVISPRKVGLETEAMKIENLPQTFHCINLLALEFYN
jgi:hypothetical protein